MNKFINIYLLYSPKYMCMTTPVNIHADSYVEIDGSDWLLLYHCFYCYLTLHAQ